MAAAGCDSEPLPEDKADYAGTWRGEGVDLTITRSGSCSYVKDSGSGRTEINAPIQRFDGDDFVVGMLGVDTTFDVTTPPHEQDGTWTMVVDGIELTRTTQ